MLKLTPPSPILVVYIMFQVVFGSTHPWYESLLVAMGASHVTVVEYNMLTYSHPNITTITPSLLHSAHQYNTALSISRYILYSI